MMPLLFRMLGNVLSPSGARARLAILTFHRVLEKPDPILREEIDAATFESHMSLLRAEFNVLPLGEASARLARNALPARAASITFDDGYANNEEVALPILERVGLTATFFVATGFLDGGTMFNDAIIETMRRAPSGAHDLAPLGLPVYAVDGPASRRHAMDDLIDRVKYRPPGERARIAEEVAAIMRVQLPTNLMMRRAQVRRLHAAGMEVGSHTVNHPILMQLDDRAARDEIIGSKRQLEEITGAPVGLFAYPNGKPGRDYGPQHVRFVRDAGFAAAFSTTAGVAHSHDDIFQLPRMSPWGDSRRLGLRILREYARPAAPGSGGHLSPAPEGGRSAR